MESASVQKDKGERIFIWGIWKRKSVFPITSATLPLHVTSHERPAHRARSFCISPSSPAAHSCASGLQTHLGDLPQHSRASTAPPSPGRPSRVLLLGLSVCLEPRVLSSGSCKASTPPRSEARGTDPGSGAHLREVPAPGWTTHPALGLSSSTSSFPARWDSSRSLRHEGHGLTHCLTSSHSHTERRFEVEPCLFLSLYIHIHQ